MIKRLFKGSICLAVVEVDSVQCFMITETKSRLFIKDFRFLNVSFKYGSLREKMDAMNDLLNWIDVEYEEEIKDGRVSINY